MNKTQFKNNFNNFFQQIINSQIISISTDKKNTIQIEYKKNNRTHILDIVSRIQMCEEGILNFSFEINKTNVNKELEPIYESINKIENITLYVAKDMFCKEQALEFCYGEDEYFYVLIYTNMVESSLEFFEEALTVEKFTKVAF